VDVSSLQVPRSAAAPSATVDSRLRNVRGSVQVIIRLPDPPLAAAVGVNAKRSGLQLTAGQQRTYVTSLTAKQDTLMRSIAAYGGSELARVTLASNALIVQVDASRLTAIAKLPNVTAIRMVPNYQIALSTTVPYIGASALQATGLNGTGVKVAVLDSGIDYTHRNLGGPGTAAAYAAAYGTGPSDSRNTTLDGLFPTAKVVAGFDFVGETWPNGPLTPDPDPIDFEGHGTHVSDIIAGQSLDGTHVGVAPGASLVAVKVCSSVSSSCSGVALLQGMDFALDPNGDGDLSDAADVISMSLGSNYGQREDDLSLAAAVASRFGVVVVAAAGNAADRPYIVSSPSVTPEVISVAETQVPTATGFPLIINSPATIAGTYGNTATVSFAPVGAGFTGNVVYVGRGCPASGATPADPYLANPAGKVALIDRGTCAVSLKVDQAANAGAIGVLIGLVASGDAVSFSAGGGTTFVPTLVITQSVANSIKANIASLVNVTVSPAFAISLAGSMVGSSARGPGVSYNTIKPDIGAPGASVSAIAGSGNGEEAFGGTSGATPMVAGSAALLLQKFPSLSPIELKARLMNAAEINVFTNPATLPGVLAPITRIGGGELRVDRASATATAAWDAGDPASVSLSFGHYRMFGTTSFKKKVVVRNYSSSPRNYAISPSFRYASDAGGAVVLSAPSSLAVPANSLGTFVFTLTVNAALLPTWTLNGGSSGGTGALLQGVEFDGYVAISGGGDSINLPWQILPHKAANVRPLAPSVHLSGGTGTFTVTNTGAARTGRIDAFALTGTSPKLSATVLPRPGDNFAVVDLKAVGARLVSVGTDYGIQFAINTWGERSHPNYPAEFDIYIDTNRDGVADFVLFNSENGGFGATGQNVVTLLDLNSNAQVVRFFNDADLDSGNVIFTALLADMGMTPSSKFDFAVLAYDNYFTGALTDYILPMTFEPDLPRFVAPGTPASLAIGSSATVTVTSPVGGDVASPSQTGLLLMYRDAQSGLEADAISVGP
jgi:subtilisin family serine protease